MPKPSQENRTGGTAEDIVSLMGNVPIGILDNTTESSRARDRYTYQIVVGGAALLLGTIMRETKDIAHVDEEGGEEPVKTRGPVPVDKVSVFTSEGHAERFTAVHLSKELHPPLDDDTARQSVVAQLAMAATGLMAMPRGIPAQLFEGLSQQPAVPPQD